MNITNIGHPSFKVADREKSLHFYRDLLGLPVKFTITYSEIADFAETGGNSMDPGSLRAFGDKVWITYLEAAPHQYIELFDDGGATEKITHSLQEFDHIGYLHLALEVEDVHAAYEELKKSGEVKIINAPNMGIEHTWQFWIEDPDGNSIELMQYTDDSWQLTGHMETR